VISSPDFSSGLRATDPIMEEQYRSTLPSLAPDRLPTWQHGPARTAGALVEAYASMTDNFMISVLVMLGHLLAWRLALEIPYAPIRVRHAR
jgi:hypothetical protein